MKALSPVGNPTYWSHRISEKKSSCYRSIKLSIYNLIDYELVNSSDQHDISGKHAIKSHISSSVVKSQDWLFGPGDHCQVFSNT